MKKNIDLSRAWRDEDYYLSLTEEERASLGIHPSGSMSLGDDVLKSIAGGCGTECKMFGTPYCTPCGTRLCQA
ncbi:MAG TPA: mersacidin/lichenicidin family type 2 lantibiotic [Thermoanaerobaculia bacterium]|nr:mersacidin/lichenicidin family type 2 lantibiotic [Thermoanaerobaculia bacterium]